MQLDLETLKTNGQQHIDQLIEASKENDWKALVQTKFQNSTPEELEFMKTLWSHGYMQGCTAACGLITDIYKSINNQI